MKQCDAPPLLDDPLLAYRDRFPILSRTNYLISNSLGAMPEAARASLQEYAELWATRGVQAWEDAWWQMVEKFGDLVAPLIGAGRGEVVFHPNVTLTHGIVFSTFDFHGNRPRIVTDAMHFPSILYLIAEQTHLGAEIVVVPSDDGITVDTERVIEAINDRTAFVNLSHVLFKSAYVHDVAAIASRAREVGALSIIDGYQAVGVLPVDVRALGVDIYIGGCLKWLCGGPGAAFLWVRPDLRPQPSPRLTGWMAHRSPFDFLPNLERRDDAWRFLTGTPNIPAFLAARPGLEIINEVGVKRIRAKSERQVSRLLSLAGSRGWPCTTPLDPARRGGTVAVNVEHGHPASQALKARGVACDYRPGAGIRFSPHFYNRDNELDDAVAALAEILATEAWRNFQGGSSVVT
ncbi:MAG TPA: aminotransferase class V-fold PLP-dependent enzyme [Isosphaeraceae bacterium]|nr:aminotransferase class V-fold PLP-dependent enzyme [Isosphaeraceae bacterium]